MPNSVTEIDAYAFNWAKMLDAVYLGDSVTTIGNYAFYQANLKAIRIPTSLKSFGTDCFNKDVETVYYQGSSAQWESIKGRTTYIDNATLFYDSTITSLS